MTIGTETKDGRNTEETWPSGTHSGEDVVKPLPERGLSRGVWIGMLFVALLVAAVVIFGILSRHRSEETLETETTIAAVPSVNVIFPVPSSISSEIALPGNTQAFVDTPIYSRTNGYLKAWYFDIGARVKKGQLMATIETPETDQQLEVARADLKSAQANFDLAKTTAARYTNLLKTNSVSKQETDVAVSDEAAKQAAVDAAMASVRRLEQLQSFEKIYAPFDGIVTARNTDIGALIEAGQNNTPKELFHLGAIGRLRVYVSVPEAYSPAIKDGGKAALTLDEYPGREFLGTIARNSSAIDPVTRTLNVEVDIDNPKGELLPGAYVFVHFKVPQHAIGLTLPSNALLFRAQGLQVAVVRGNHAQLIPVKIGKDHGQTVEISEGLTQDDAVIVNPSDSIADGQKVQVSNRQDAEAKRAQEIDAAGKAGAK